MAVGKISADRSSCRDKSVPGFYLKQVRRPEEQHLPLAQYFFRVGGVLLALLLALNAYLPKLPVADRAQANLPVIRIHSDRKWPERVVFDTRLPAIIPAQVARSEPGLAHAETAGDVSAKARGREALAQMQPSDIRQLQPATPKNRNQGRNIREGSQGSTRRRIARRHRSGNLVGTVRVSGEEVSRRARADLDLTA